MRALPLCLFSLLLAAPGHAQCDDEDFTEHAQNGQSCVNSYYILEKQLLCNSENRFQLLKAFYHSRNPRPVVVRVQYEFPDGSNTTWFWSESQFYLIQPLEIFQFTSLFFSNLPSRQTQVSIMLSQQCANASDEYLEILTQRLKLYATSSSVSPEDNTRPISDDYVALSASYKEINSDALLSTFLKVWLHVFLVLFPLCTLFCILLCDPVQLLLGDQVWTKLEDESNHPRIAALIQVSVIFTALVFMLDIMALTSTVLGDYLVYDRHAAFYLSTVTGMIVDTVAFVWVMFVLVKSCHWDCKNFWYRWKKRQPCNKGESERIKKLMSTLMVAPVLCFSNHIHYVILALIADPFHAAGIILIYLISFALFYFLFRQFYSFVVFRSYHRKMVNERKVFAIRIPSRQDLLDRSSLKGSKKSVKIERVPFNTQTVVFGLMILTPLILLYEGIIVALFVSLPISKTIEDAPSRVYSIYQGTGILIVGLLTYNIVLAPKGFSVAKAFEQIAKHIELPHKIKNWNLLTDEEKCANVCNSFLHEIVDHQVIREKSSSLLERSLEVPGERPNGGYPRPSIERTPVETTRQSSQHVEIETTRQSSEQVETETGGQSSQQVETENEQSNELEQSLDYKDDVTESTKFNETSV